MMEVYLLSASLVVAGLYITYQNREIRRYKYTLTYATLALEAAYDHIAGVKDDDTDSE